MKDPVRATSTLRKPSTRKPLVILLAALLALSATALFMLGASPVAVAAPGPVVVSIDPGFSGTSASVSVTDLHGMDFVDGASVKLTRAGSADITATNVTVVSATQITCDLDLAGAATGAWNVVVTNPDTTTGRLANGFFVGTMSGLAWGWNNYGQCGVPAYNDLVAIAGGGYHSLAVRADGSLAA